MNDSIKQVDVKKTPISLKELEYMYSISKSYEKLFNKRALLFRDIKKDLNNITEELYKELMLKHYSFLKRPILIIEKRLFIGNSKETVLKAKIELDKL